LSPFAGSQTLDTNLFFDSLQRDLALASERVVIFSPFIAPRRLERILDWLQPLIDRGIRVTAITKSDDELDNPRLIDELIRAGVKVLQRHGMHEKVVLIDRHITYVGSLNTLSNNGRSDEIMLRLEGEKTNHQIDRWMKQAVKPSQSA